MPEEALRELQATARPSLWTARLAVVSLVVTVINAAITVGRSPGVGQIGGAIGGLVVAVPLSVYFLGLYRRYADNARRLRTEPRALTVVIDTQASLFKSYGVMMIIAFAFVFVATVIGILVGIARRG